MIDSGVMAFAEQLIDNNKDFDLLITPEDLLDLWGPGTVVPSQSSRPESISPTNWVSKIEIRSGVVYKPSTDSSKMHWKATSADDVHKGVPFESSLRMKMIIGAIMVRQQCPTKPGPDNTVSRTNINSDIKELGTWPEKWNLREKQVGFQLGQYFNATFNGTWIKSESRTRKLQGLDMLSLDFLDKPWGLLVSVCTGVAQRVALREVVAEVMLPITDGWIEKPKHWKTLLSTGEGLFEELKKPQFRDWAKNLDHDLQDALRLFLEYVLHKVCWTGVNSAGSLVVACPQFGDSGSCVHIPCRESRALTWIFKDTERSATFACLANTCFDDVPNVAKCQNIAHPQWQNRVPALITSVCQFRWLGADKWERSPQTLLNDGDEHLLGTSEEKRKVTIETSSNVPARLKVSDSPIRWPFRRRMWEQVGRVRTTLFIELRERTLMTEDHARDVIVFREYRT